ncbi:MAG: gliding motility-associated C-terminal domain-containing protein [Bacteroidales bacterium]|nr:gliding motility-associated C-terminal domain-containing protein [Candidatus Colimorpha onthohippi]
MIQPKHFIAIAIMLVLGTGYICAQNLPHNIPSRGLIGYYPFDMDSRDISDNNNHALLKSQAYDLCGGSGPTAPEPIRTADRFGNEDSAYQFRGAFIPGEGCFNAGIWNNSWMEVAATRTSTAIDTALTVAFWLNLSTTQGMNSRYTDSTYGTFTLIDRSVFDVGKQMQGLTISATTSANNRLTVSVQCADTTTHKTIQTYAAFNCYHTGEWLHTAIVIHRNKVRIYFNGTLYHQYTASANFPLFITNAMPFNFGCRGGRNWALFPLNGILDDIALWNAPLSDQEVKGLCDFHGDSDSVVIDSVIVTDCTPQALGTITVYPKAGNGPYQYAVDNIYSFTNSNIIKVRPGVHTVWVRNNCSQWDTTITVGGEGAVYTTLYDSVCYGTTSQLIIDTIFYEDFSNGISTSWTNICGQTQEARSRGWSAYDTVIYPTKLPWNFRDSVPAYSSPYCVFEPSAIQGTSTGAQSYLITPRIKILDPQNTYISFEYVVPAWKETATIKYTNNFGFGYSAFNDGSFTILWTNAAADESGNIQINDALDWTHFQQTLDDIETNGMYHIVFANCDNGGIGTGIDNILIYGPIGYDIPLQVTQAAPYSTIDVIDTLTSISGLDSIVTTHWFVKPAGRLIDTMSCDTFYWERLDTMYRASEDTIYQYINSYDCPSSDTLQLTMHYSTLDTLFDTVNYDERPYKTPDGQEFYYRVRDTLIQLKDVYGCDSNYKLNLDVRRHIEPCDTFLQFPSIVTPNGDGVNDKFLIVGVDRGCYPTNKLIIYNRFGMAVCRRENITSYDDCWDPKHMPASTYFYYFEARSDTDAIIRRGCFEIVK